MFISKTYVKEANKKINCFYRIKKDIGLEQAKAISQTRIFVNIWLLPVNMDV